MMATRFLPKAPAPVRGGLRGRSSWGLVVLVSASLGSSLPASPAPASALAPDHASRDRVFEVAIATVASEPVPDIALDLAPDLGQDLALVLALDLAPEASSVDVRSALGSVPDAFAPASPGRIDVLASKRGLQARAPQPWALTPNAPGTPLRLQVGGTPESEEGSSPNRKAILYSLLLPGLAQYEMGERTRGVGFMVAEAAFWTSFAAFRIQGANREDSYIEMAELFAGIDPDVPRSDDFYKQLAGWPSSDLYNEFIIRREARAFGGDDLEARAEYYEANHIRGDGVWDWDSEADRGRYREKRSDAQLSFKRSRNMIGLAVANRVIAMIDAVLLSGRIAGSSYRLDVSPRAEDGAWTTRVSLGKRLP